MAKHSALFDGSADAGDIYGYEESTFSIPKALSLFFGVVLMAGIFFGGGYHMGHSAALNQQAASVPGALTSAPSPVYSAKEKPAAALEVTDTPAATQSAPAPVMTENAALNTPPAQEAPRASRVAATAAQTGSFTVQVAAVRHEEDAEALLGALRKKQYPVFLASANSDSLFHVQVGPFPDQKEAEGMRARLAGDGYNAIVKK
jgi:DedD protein